ncbi:uncharacterized protein B0I36DRAFT_360445 [Microdochium trichocladiopsis]|uniref:Uncharacterized protein n=1 Tax=Microdochium trichocladiopsis TaxID=1682393 RepID=A0A9P9BQK8_9PEZI|nr:uncharacterized protein B0I36DRAFT_360445 [Microdochium trichocladiopsis]KAH7034993.1 hypothetical protein B0I36DRAFT_360445 [Microdochium trichocladiopsis]
MVPSKKRRRQDGDNDSPSIATDAAPGSSSQAVLSQGLDGTQAHQPSPLHLGLNHDDLGYSSPSWASMNVHRKMAPLPATKKSRLIHECESQPPTPIEQQNIHNTMIRSHSQPVLGSAHAVSTSPILSPHLTPSLARPTEPSRANSAVMLSPCHICHRKPTKKSDLDSFADCMGCNQRTCYICIRQCQNWLTKSPAQRTQDDDGVLSSSFTMKDADDPENEDTRPNQPDTRGGGRENRHASSWRARGHRDVICSRCCVERGSEGEVVCLGCLSRIEGA